ncbi:cysteine--1-D-myo-inosityl 2-amino-2-deoxy-alpha-D-glucopyranoside ligase [Kribbia dieselivorans]|uniref:cysteine--1-D-myo-inosityl 2-amino-2-deoxy-alpha-D-glucopyranoside ligase n=1 Tax=Kribbia dieselivorans TaxID=331526 RepID=UPI000837B06C|nr:cysteine--1-D-myo-inosityl 2-amino-2-deoxy-alpha-D-glucopyranoside ligase [Kribbia dieselivorans]
MKTWPQTSIPELPGTGVPPRIFDTPSGTVRPVDAGPTATMYVCGVTPYDTTHLGHAATYVTFDILNRALRDAGHEVRYVQNVTDVDDPLLERATRDGVHWTDLARDQITLFHEDMTDLAVLPPEHYVGVVEAMQLVIDAVDALTAAGATYAVANDDTCHGPDLYLDLAKASTLGSVSQWSREDMLGVFGERGGDPGRPGKRDKLDPLLWRAQRDGEPSWEGGDLGPGRPGWHIECTAIALHFLGKSFDIQGGGADLVFPHHEMSSAQAECLGTHPFARRFVHQALLSYDGHKMSKSRGNLVRVSQLRAQGADSVAIRMALLRHHYRTEWEWVDADLTNAESALARWRQAVSVNTAPDAEALLVDLRAAIADDLDTPKALAAIDHWVDTCLTSGGHNPTAPGLVARMCDALLGLRL